MWWASEKLARVDHLHAVAFQLVLRDPDFAFHNVLYSQIQVRHGHVFFAVVVDP